MAKIAALKLERNMVAHPTFHLDHVLEKHDKLSMDIDKDTRAWCEVFLIQCSVLDLNHQLEGL